MVNEMSKFIYQYNAQILPPIWQLLTQTAEIYVKVVVNDSGSNTFDNDDDELNNFSSLILQLIEFIHSIVEKGRFRHTISTVLTDLVYISIVYMQITQEQIEAWTDDAELYVDDFNIENCECTIRVSSNDVLTNIAEEFGPKVLLPALSEALARHVSVAEAEKAAQNSNWWKIIEASTTAVGSLKSFVVNNEDTKFNLKEYLAYVKAFLGRGGDGSGYQQDVSPFLHGKCLWLLSRYSDAAADIYDRQTLQIILNCTANNLSNNKPMVIQVSAMRSLYELCQGLKSASDEQRAMVIEKLPGFINFIMDIATRAKSNILSELLLTISTVLAVRIELTFSKQTKLLLNIFLNLLFSLINHLRQTITPELFHLQSQSLSNILKIHLF